MALLGLMSMRDCWNLGGVLTSDFFSPTGETFGNIYILPVWIQLIDEALEKFAKLLIGT
jgi:hypothetical protein